MDVNTVLLLLIVLALWKKECPVRSVRTWWEVHFARPARRRRRKREARDA